MFSERLECGGSFEAGGGVFWPRLDSFGNLFFGEGIVYLEDGGESFFHLLFACLGLIGKGTQGLSILLLGLFRMEDGRPPLRRSQRLVEKVGLALKQKEDEMMAEVTVVNGNSANEKSRKQEEKEKRQRIIRIKADIFMKYNHLTKEDITKIIDGFPAGENQEIKDAFIKLRKQKEDIEKILFNKYAKEVDVLTEELTLHVEGAQGVGEANAASTIHIVLEHLRRAWKSKDPRNIESALDEAEALLAKMKGIVVEKPLEREDKEVDALLGSMARNFLSGGRRIRSNRRSQRQRQLRRSRRSRRSSRKN
jgi:hypothetical protein